MLTLPLLPLAPQLDPPTHSKKLNVTECLLPCVTRALLKATTTPRLPREANALSGCEWVSPHGLLGFVVLQCLPGIVVPFPQSAGRGRRLRGGAGYQSCAGCSGAKMAARRGRRDRLAPPPTGGPSPDPGGGVRGSSRGSRSQAPYGTVGTVSGGEQVRDWRVAQGWQQSGVCRAVTRGRHRKGRKSSRVDARWLRETGWAE